MKYKTRTFIIIGTAILLLMMSIVFVTSVHSFTHPTFPPPTGTSGPIPVINGGTGASTAAGARNDLGAAASGANSDITSLTPLSGSLNIFGQLKINGLLTLLVSTSAPVGCDSSKSGAIYFNDTDKSVYDCNAMSWNKLGAAIPATGTITYLTPGIYTWTVPDGVYRIFVQIWGAGGSGGLGNYVAGSYFSGGGGSSGSYGAAFMSVVPLSGISVVVGQGGNGVSPSNGSSTSFGTLIVSGGNKGETFTGSGGAAGGIAPLAPTGTVWSIVRAGNAGADSWGGDTNSVAGGGGGTPSLIGTGTSGLPTPAYNGAGGTGGSSSNVGGDGGGNGGNGATYSTSHTGNPGGMPGGGGGGSWGLTSFAAGNGGNGQVIVWW